MIELKIWFDDVVLVAVQFNSDAAWRLATRLANFHLSAHFHRYRPESPLSLYASRIFTIRELSKWDQIDYLVGKKQMARYDSIADNPYPAQSDASFRNRPGSAAYE